MEVNYGGGGAGLDTWITFLLYLFISLAITWLIIYTAVRAAVGHALDRMKPRFVAEATATPDGVRFVVSNVGSAPAVDVAVRWTEQPSGEPIVRTAFVGVSARFEWELAVAQVPGTAGSVRGLRLQWSGGPDRSRETATCVVLVPARPNAAA
jgi:hypothetical protein